MEKTKVLRLHRVQLVGGTEIRIIKEFEKPISGEKFRFYDHEHNTMHTTISRVDEKTFREHATIVQPERFWILIE